MAERCKSHAWVAREGIKGDVYRVCAECGKKRGTHMKYPYRQRTLPPANAVDKDGVTAWEAR